MKSITQTIVAVGIVSIKLGLSACVATPSAEDTVPQAQQPEVDVPDVQGNKATDVQTVANSSGLSTVNTRGERTVRCRKKRGTGSNIRRSRCEKRSRTSSQPIRTGLDLPEVDIITSGGPTRPSN